MAASIHYVDGDSGLSKRTICPGLRVKLMGGSHHRDYSVPDDCGGDDQKVGPFGEIRSAIYAG